MNAPEASAALNEVAHEVLHLLEAGAVVVLALVKDGDDVAVAVGSTGLPHTTRVIAQALPGISRELIQACDKEEKTEKCVIINIGETIR